MMTLQYLLSTLVASPLLGCGDSEAGSGSALVSVNGERAAEEALPVGEGDDEIAFADGYNLQFDSVLVLIREL